MEQYLRQGLTKPHLRVVEISYFQALAYVWGRQDAGEGKRDTFRSEEFARAFAGRGRAFLLEKVTSMPPLESAWKDWNETGEIA